MQFKKQLACLFFISLTYFCNGQSSLQKTINKWVKDDVLKHASVSIAVVDIESGQIIAKYNKDKSLSPASILKILTTSSALGILGGDYTFKTDLNYTGKIDKEGTLHGNLFITGYGDPTLGSDRWEGLEGLANNFSTAVLKAGIRCIDGSIVGDGSYFDSAATPNGWPWQDLGNYYAAGAWGLNINENLYQLSFAQAPKEGQKPRIIGISPEINNLSFINELTSGASGSGDNAYIYGAPYSYTRFVRGSIPRGKGTFSIKGSIPDAPLFAAQHMATILEKEGIIPSKGIFSDLTYYTKLPKKATLHKIFRHQSPPLREIVKITNHKSINLYCEAMLKTLASNATKKGNTLNGIAKIKSYWEERGLDFQGMNIVDGSGLSRSNIISSSFMAHLLRKIAINKTIYKDFYNSLSIAGKTGYVKSLLRGTRAEGNIRVKTGTIGSVRSFAGYATMRSGKKVSFCIIVNNFEGSGRNIRKKCAKIMLAICE